MFNRIAAAQVDRVFYQNIAIVLIELDQSGVLIFCPNEPVSVIQLDTRVSEVVTFLADFFGP